MVVGGILARAAVNVAKAAQPLVARAANTINKVIASSPISKIPQKTIASRAGLATPVPPSLRNTVAKSPTAQSTAVPTTRQRVVQAAKGIAPTAAAVGAGAVIESISDTGGTTAGGLTGAVIGGLKQTPAKGIKRVLDKAGSTTLGAIGGALAGTAGANIAEGTTSRPIADNETPQGVIQVSSDRKTSTRRSSKKKSSKKKATSRKTGSKRSMPQKMVKVQNLMKEAGAKWRKMSNSEKSKYENKFSDYVKVYIEPRVRAKK